MDEEKKIMEKRSSFRGWKERNKGKMHLKRNAIGILIIISILLATVTYPYWNKIGGNNVQNKTPSLNKTPFPTPIKNIKANSSNSDNSSSLKTTPNMTNIPKKNVVGKIGVPLVSNGGFEINLIRANPTELRTAVWITVRNKDNYDKPLKLGPGTIILDNIGQQYENIRVARSAEISQTNLAAYAMREGAIFFERLRDGRTLKKLILNINDDKIEFMLNASNSSNN